MNRFVRIKEVEIGNDDVFILNLDVVAIVTLTSQEGMVPGSNTPGAYVELKSSENSALANFYLDTFDEGKRWVLKRFGIET